MSARRQGSGRRLRVALFQPLGRLDTPSVYMRTAILEPLGIEYIGSSVLSNSECDVTIAPGAWSLDRFACWLQQEDADVVGLSAYTYAVGLCLEVARRVKAANRRVVTVLGGYHPTAVPETVDDPHVDYVITGPGEDAFTTLLRAIAHGAPPDVGTVLPGSRMPLAALPWPLRNHEILRDAKIHSIMFPPPSGQTAVAQVSYSRGCPHACLFCSSPQMFGREVSWRSAHDVADEIEMLCADYGVNTVFFTDLTFNADEGKVVELCDEILRRRLDISWHCMCSANGLSKTTIELMAAAGCRKVAWGVETADDDTRMRLKPRCGGEIEEVAVVLKSADDCGIINRGYTMMGLPGQSPTDAIKDYRRISELALDELRISFFVPFPGTALAHRAAAVAETVSYDKYTGEIPLLASNAAESEEWQRLRSLILWQFHSSDAYRQRVQSKLKRFPHLEKSFQEYAEFRDTAAPAASLRYSWMTDMPLIGGRGDSGYRCTPASERCLSRSADSAGFPERRERS